MAATGLRLVVDNLGPIGHAEVDLKPLTVLIGKNNTGKTYLAQAIYAAHKAAGDHLGVSDLLTKNEIRLLLKENWQIIARRTTGGSFILPIDLQVKAKRWINYILDHLGEPLERNLCNYFGVSELSNITRWDQPKEIKVELHLNQADTQRTLLFRNTKIESSNLFEVPTETFDIDSELVRSEITFWQIEEGDVRTREISFFIAYTVWNKFLDIIGLSRNAHYLPAGRSGLLNAWTDVVKLRFELERERFGLSKFPESSLGGVAFDFISSLAGIIGPRHRHRFRRPYKGYLSDETGPLALLTELMGGKIRAGSVEELVPTLEYEQDGHRIAVHHASSMVADLAPLAMWIEHLVSQKDLLIIDEPESHLHPEAIRLVARVLVGLVNQGVRVVCATHSSVLLHELSNCILREQLSHKSNENIGTIHAGTDRIALDNIAVYRFQRPEPTGPVNVTPEEINPNWGIPEDEYVQVASELSDDTANLIDQLT